jgi:hypothetical protein
MMARFSKLVMGTDSNPIHFGRGADLIRTAIQGIGRVVET